MMKIPLIRYSLLALIIFFISCKSTGPSFSYEKSRKSRTERVSAGSRSSPKKIKKDRKNVKNVTVRSTVVAESKKYRGIQYKYGGKKPQSGFDCSGFSTFVLQKSGIKISGSSSQLSLLGNYVKKKNLNAGDLAFFGTDGKVTHVGIVVSNSHNQLKVIHSTSSKGVIISDVNASNYWKNKYLFGKDVITNYRDGYTGVD